MIIEAAETAFVPAAIYNNTEGDEDARVLASFDEPTWNNPVVRVIDAERRDLVERFARGWELAGMASTMRAALEAAGHEAPEWFADFEAEAGAHRRGVATAVFGMT
jgi:hypothetical protein